jgi:3-methylcrotonyl-CoA carboxylase alpha subunit
MRDEAIKTMDLALNEIVFLGKGIKTNRSYLKRILKTEEFKKGLTYTHFVNTYKDKLQPVTATNSEQAMAIAAFLFSKAGKVHRSDLKDVWSRLEGFRNV